jgi:ribosomal protein S6--L-glutamate ligase
MSEVVFDGITDRVSYREHDLRKLHGLVIKKLGETYSPAMLDRLELLCHVASHGVPIFSKPTSILALIDRLSCTMTLSRAGIPMPATLVTEDPWRAAQAVREFEVAVLKPLYSTKARGIRLLDTRQIDDVEAEIRDFQAGGSSMVYVQKKIPVPGRDLGVAFLGGEYIGTYARVSGGQSWNTTIHDGGHYAPHEPSAETIDVARRAQALFDLDFTTVDVVETDDGPLVFEVSAFGGFRGLLDGLGVDVAPLVARYVVDRVVAPAVKEEHV